ncbi:MAG: hypothetical protein JXA10_04950 [Anaerolineae bacterium]|nr:hypothetical protein [Anaerolineae bacterium]
MTREPLDRLLATVSDEELESLRDAILREEGRRRLQLNLVIEAPFPPLVREESDRAESVVERWARLITWLAKDAAFPPAGGKRGVSICFTYAGESPDVHEAGIIIQQALVQAGLLLGRTPEWMDATTTQAQHADDDQRATVRIQMWDKPDYAPWHELRDE